MSVMTVLIMFLSILIFQYKVIKNKNLNSYNNKCLIIIMEPMR
jgi:hypothetical protein